MAIDFPNSPTTGSCFSFDQRTWKWDGTAWILVVSGVINYNIDGGTPSSNYVGSTNVDGGTP